MQVIFLICDLYIKYFIISFDQFKFFIDKLHLSSLPLMVVTSWALFKTSFMICKS